jgi:5-bromo-4-chloroindolyl phosphate hydrolysis protein
MAKVVKKSVAPIYLVGIVWLVYALLFPLYRVSDYLLCAGLSLVAFIVGKAIWPDATLIVADQEEKKAQPAQAEQPKKTGNEELDKLLDERDKAISEMRRLNDAIQDEKISAQIDHLEMVTKKIIDQVVAQPKKLPQIRKFMNYYLPTTLKLLNAYDRMSDAGVDGENITATKQKVEEMMDTITKAFDKQLDALYGEEALDISTDITVMEQMLQQEGFGGLNLGAAQSRQSGDGDIDLHL